MRNCFNILFLGILSFSIQAQDDLINQADSLYSFGNYTEAIKAYKNSSNPDLVYEKIAKAYLALGNYDGALSNYKQAYDSNPENILLKYDYAKLLARTKSYEQAAILFNELVYYDYKNPNFHYELGLVLEQQGDVAAMNRFHSAFSLDKTHQKTIYKIAKYYLVKRNYEESLKTINIGLESYENNAELISLKALNYYWMEDYAESSRWFEKLLALGENSQFIHEKLRFSYSQQKSYKKAIEHAIKAVEFDPKNSQNLFVLGELYGQIKDFLSAEEYLKKALELIDVSLASEYKALGVVLNQQNKTKEAIAAFQNAVKENPKDDTAQFYLVRTKDEFYADLDTKIKLYEKFKIEFSNSRFNLFVDNRLKKLKNEKFMKADTLTNKEP